MPSPLDLQRQLFAQPISNTSLLINYIVERNSNEVRMGCQVGKAYRVALQEGDTCFSVLALLLILAFTTQARKKSNQKGEESPYDKDRRLSIELGTLPLFPSLKTLHPCPPKQRLA